MAKDYIQIADAKEKGNQLTRNIAQLRVISLAIEHLRDIMLHNIDGTDRADMEVLFGIPTGDGEAVYNLVNTTVTQLNHSDVQTLFDRVGNDQ